MQRMYCVKCGSHFPFDKNIRYCPKCGGALKVHTEDNIKKYFDRLDKESTSEF